MKKIYPPLLKGDIIIIISVIISALLIFFITSDMLIYESDVIFVEINLNGDIIHKLSIEDDVEILVEDNYQNLVVIEGNSVKVINSTCPDGVCENFGNIQKEGQTIICMPNKLIIQISGTQTEIDVIT